MFDQITKPGVQAGRRLKAKGKRLKEKGKRKKEKGKRKDAAIDIVVSLLFYLFFKIN